MPKSSPPERQHWPYPSLLPHSLKMFPVVQTAPDIGPRGGREWPRPRSRALDRWAERRGGQGAVQHQIYLHIPFCPFLCGFCPLFKVERASQRTPDVKQQFVEALLGEIELYGRHADWSRTPFSSVYFGGGTPTELAPEQLTRILAALRANFGIAADAEITLEGVARQMLAPGYLQACLTGGFNRISFGVQSLDQEVRRQVGRGDRSSDYEQVIALARQLQPNVVINIDLLAGLPGQTQGSLARDLEVVSRWPIHSVDVLYYVPMPGTKVYRMMARGERGAPGCGEPLLDARRLIHQTLTAAGFQQVSGEVFVRDERDVFIQASLGGGAHALNTVLALGPSAFGLVGGRAYQNVCDLPRYLASVAEGRFPTRAVIELTPALAHRRALLYALVKLFLPDALLGGPRYRRLVRRWQRRGLVERVPGGYRLSPMGALWYNHMQMEVLSWRDRVALSRMLGSAQQHQHWLSTPAAALSPFEREILHLMRGRGWTGRLQFLAYRLLVWTARGTRRGRVALGFTGPVDPGAVTGEHLPA